MITIMVMPARAAGEGNEPLQDLSMGNTLSRINRGMSRRYHGATHR
jgi:hypothetical protein